MDNARAPGYAGGRSPAQLRLAAGLRTPVETDGNQTISPNENGDFDFVPRYSELRELNTSITRTIDQEMELDVDREIATTLVYEHEAELKPYPVHSFKCIGDSIYTPCGCKSITQDIYTMPWYGPQVHFAYQPEWSSGRDANRKLNFHTLIGEEGLVIKDCCWCPVNDVECVACQPIYELLEDSNVERWDVDPDIVYDVLKFNKYFSFKVFYLEKERRGEIWDDTLMCLKYNGPNLKPRTYHVLFYSSPLSSRRVYVGPFIPIGIYNNSFESGEELCIHNPLTEVVWSTEVVRREPSRLDTLAALAVSRLENKPTWTHDLLRQHLNGFRIGSSYVLPMPGLCSPLTQSPHNYTKGVELVACAGERDGPEMENTIIQNQQHNVDLAETTEPSTSHVASVEFGVLPWIYDECHTYPDLTERWVRFTDFQWTTSQTAGAILYRFDLPFDAIIQSQNTPNALPWRQHAFFRCDMEIMLQLNSQPAQSGYIVMGTMYNASELTGASARVTDVAHVLQMPHTIVAAGASNSGVLYVPWMRHFPVSPVLDSNWDYPMYYHTLFIAVLAPLRTGADGPVTADCVLQVRFPNLEFYGMRNTVEVVNPTVLTATGWIRDLTEEGVEPNPGPLFGSALAILGGISTAAKTVSSIASTVSGIASSIGSFGSKAKNVVDSTESLLRKVYPKEDMDRPQDIREPVNMYLQQNTSLSLATGINKIKLLQLQAENTVTHPPAFVPADDQFSTRYITEVFGQIDLIQWSTTQVRGTQLFQWPVTPLCAKNININIGDNARCIPTPIGAISSYYSGYHGNMLMRLTFALSKFHSGRVYIVYSPDQVPFSDDVGALYATLLDVQDQSQYTFVVPYQIPATFAPLYANPRGFTVEDPNSNGTVNIPHYGYVSIFVENELRVMETASPTIDIVVEVAGSTDFSLLLPCGSPLRNLPSILPTVLEATGMEGASVENQVDQGDERTKVVDASTPLRNTYPAWALNINETYDIRDVVKRYVPWFEALIPAINPNAATVPLINVSVYHSPLSSIDSASPIITPEWTTLSSANLENILGSSRLIACERVKFDMNTTISFRVPWTTNASVLSNGIDPTLRFNQLPAYCNGRVHVVLELATTSYYYLSWDVTLGSAGQRELGYRPDLITTLHDAFRFSKSDFNYQLDFNVGRTSVTTLFNIGLRVYRAMGDGGNFYIFQGFPSYNTLFTPALNLIGGSSSAAGVMGIAQFHNKRPKVFSTPHARVTRTGLVVRPDPVRDLTKDGDVESNPGPEGDSEAGPSRPAPTDSEYFSTEEQEELGRAGMFGSAIRKVTDYLKATRGYTREAVNSWWAAYQYKREYVANLSESLTTVVDFVKKVEEFDNEASRAKFEKVAGAFESIGRATDNFNNLFEAYTENGEVSATVASLEHALKYSTFLVNIWQSQSIYQTLLNVITLLSEMGVCRIAATRIVDYFRVTAMADNDDDAEELSKGWSSLVITSVLAAFGLSAAVIKGTNIGGDLLKEAREYFRTGFNVKKFLDCHFKCLMELVNWIKVKIFGGEAPPSTEDLATDLVVWMEKVHTLTEIYNFEHLLSDPKFAKRVLDLQDECGRFDIQFATSKKPAPAMYSVNKGRLQRAVDTLGKQGGLRRNRCTPFCIWLWGDSGAGKSYISDEVLINVGEVLGVRSNDPIYYRSLDVEYWNGYNQQKLIAIQDFAKISTGENFRRHVGELSSLIEPYPVNPPFAELEDKKRIVDAVAVLVTSNLSFPPVQNAGMTVDSLFYRRRHALIHVRFKESVVKRYAEMGIQLMGKSDNQNVYYPSRILQEEREANGDYFYLEFGFHQSGIDKNDPVKYYNFSEMIEKLRDQALEHRTKEMAGLHRKEVLYSRLAPEHETTGNEFKERLIATGGERPSIVHADCVQITNDNDDGSEVPVNDITSGRMEIQVKLTGSEECDCGQDNPAPLLVVKKYCRNHQPSKPPPVTVKEVCDNELLDDSVTRIENVIHLRRDDGPKLPLDPRRETAARQMIKWFNTKFERPLPAGYAYWHEVSFGCCHDPAILDRAYFEVVGDRIEAVIEYDYHYVDIMEQSTVFQGMTFPKRRADRTVEKIVLTSACPVSVLSRITSLVLPQGTIHNNIADAGVFPLSPFRTQWKCQCDLTRPFKGFVVVDGVVKVYAQRGLFNIKDVESQAALLNQCLGELGVSSADVFNTFFAYEFASDVRWKHYGRRVITAAADTVTILMIMASFAGAVYLAYRLYNFVRTMFKMNATASQSGDVRRTDNVKNPPLRFAPAKATAVSLNATGEEKIVALSNNFVQVSKGRLQMWGLRLCHDFVLVPYHLLVADGDLSISALVNGVYSPAITYKPEEIQVSQMQGENGPLDIAIIRLVGMPAAKNIINYWCKEMESASLKSISTWIKPVGEEIKWGDTEIQPYYSTNVSYVNTGMESMRTELLGFKMKNGSNPHKCGTLLMSNDVLCGLVVAAKTLTSESFAVSISREMLVEGLRVLGATPFDMKMKITPPEVVGGTPKMLPPNEGDFILIGKAEKGVTYAGKTRLTPSIIHGELSQPFRSPAAQKLEATGACTGFDVVMNGCKRQFKKPITISNEEVQHITRYLIERIVPNSKPVRIINDKPVDLETAIIGIPKSKFTAMKLNTAIGWPLMTKFPRGYKKKDIIKVNEERTAVEIHRLALEEYNLANEGRKRGICANTVFMDFPKDELLKAGKATRLINGAPLHHTIDMKRYCGEFLESVVKLENKIAVGVDVHSTDWVEVHAGHDDVVNEDYKNFGPGFHSQWLDVIADIIVAWVRQYKTKDPEYENVVRCLIRENQNATHIAGDLIFQVLCGSASGVFATDRMNSLANLCYHCLCYLRKYKTLTGFWEHYLVVYGDDTRRAHTAYSFEEFNECMRSIGITVELDKGGNTFLKREFKPYNYNGINILLAPLPLPIVGDIVNWVKKPVFDQVGALAQSIDSYLSEMFHHGQDRFETARSQLREIMGRYGRNPDFKDFNVIWSEKYGKSGFLPVGRYVDERGEILKHDIATLYFDEESDDLVVYD